MVSNWYIVPSGKIAFSIFFTEPTEEGYKNSVVLPFCLSARFLIFLSGDASNCLITSLGAPANIFLGSLFVQAYNGEVGIVTVFNWFLCK